MFYLFLLLIAKTNLTHCLSERFSNWSDPIHTHRKILVLVTLRNCLIFISFLHFILPLLSGNSIIILRHDILLVSVLVWLIIRLLPKILHHAHLHGSWRIKVILIELTLMKLIILHMAWYWLRSILLVKNVRWSWRLERIILRISKWLTEIIIKFWVHSTLRDVHGIWRQRVVSLTLSRIVLRLNRNSLWHILLV